MSASLETLLAPGEEVRFEAHARGWPPLSGGMLFALGALAVTCAVLDIFGAALSFTLPQGMRIPVPLLAIPAALFVLAQFWRFVAFRSRLCVVTSERVLVLAGVFRVKVRAEMKVSLVRSVQLLGGTPAVLTRNGKFLLPGLDAVDLEAIRMALGSPPLLAALDAPRYSAKRIALFVIIALVVFLEAFGWIERREQARFERVYAALNAALAAATQSTKTALRAENGAVVFESHRRSEMTSNPFTGEGDIEVQVNTRGDDWPIFHGHARLRRTLSLTGGLTSLNVWEVPGKRAYSGRYSKELRRELARALEGLDVEIAWSER